MTKIYLNQLSIMAPGMMGLTQALPILRGEQAWQDTPMEKIVPEMLPANERRRTTPLIKLALRAGQEAMPGVGAENSIATVFASSDGDLEITDSICRALLSDDKPVSPIQFHNSVHNAAAGYWAIAAQFQHASVSLSAGDTSFTAGLLEAVSQILLDAAPVLYLAYDYPAPPPLHAARQFEFPFATGMLLSMEKSETCMATLEISLCQDMHEPSRCVSDTLEKMRHGNPIAQSLPLLEAIVTQAQGTVYLPYLCGQTIKVSLCQ